MDICSTYIQHMFSVSARHNTAGGFLRGLKSELLVKKQRSASQSQHRLCREQELMENEMCLKRHRQNSSSKYMSLGNLYTHPPPPWGETRSVVVTHARVKSLAETQRWEDDITTALETHTHFYIFIHVHAPPPPPRPLSSHTDRPHHTCIEHFHTENDLLSWRDIGVAMFLIWTSYLGGGGCLLCGYALTGFGGWGLNKQPSERRRGPSRVLWSPSLVCLCVCVCIYMHVCLHSILLPTSCLGPAPASVMMAQSRKEVWLIFKQKSSHTRLFHARTLHILSVSNAIEREAGRIKAWSRRQVADAVIHQQKHFSPVLPRSDAAS